MPELSFDSVATVNAGHATATLTLDYAGTGFSTARIVSVTVAAAAHNQAGALATGTGDIEAVAGAPVTLFAPPLKTTPDNQLRRPRCLTLAATRLQGQGEHGPPHELRVLRCAPDCRSAPDEIAALKALSDWLLTGIPRAGTSLCCRLAGQLPNTVALSEPIDSMTFADTEDPAEACERIAHFMGRTRQRILTERLAESVHVQGRVDDDMVAAKAEDGALRPRRTERGDLRIDKPLSPDFMLLVKHNALFTALLPRLIRRFRCLGLVRNPVAVLASWQTVALPVQQGRVPAGERFAPELRTALARQPGALERQLVVLDWFFEQYEKHLPPERIVRYEDVVATRGTALFRILASPLVGEFLTDRSAQSSYGTEVERLAAALQHYDGAWRRFYTPKDCEDTMLALVQQREFVRASGEGDQRHALLDEDVPA